MVLTNTVPVHGGAVILHLIVDVDDHIVAPFCPDGRARVLAIDLQAKLVTVAVRIASGVGDREVVGDSVAGRGKFLIEIGGNAVTILPACATERTICASRVLSLSFL